MSSEFSDLLATWYTEEELEEKYREFANFQTEIITREETRREIAVEIYSKRNVN